MPEQVSEHLGVQQPTSSNVTDTPTANDSDIVNQGGHDSDKQLQVVDKRRRQYGRTELSGNASAVQGDIVHNNYYYGGSVPYLADLSVSRDSTGVTPDIISPYDAELNLWLRTQQYLDGTCTWLINTKEYKKWAGSRDDAILICSGSVGCGKSIAAGFVIQSLALRPAPRPYRVVISYFVDATRHEPTTTTEILRALIKQVLQQSKLLDPDKYQRLRRMLNPIFPSSQSRADIATMIHIFGLVMDEFISCICVIDGIDALSESEINSFLDFMPRTFTPKPMPHKLIAFCRSSLGRGVRLQQLRHTVHVKFDMHDLRKDLQLFINHGVDSRQRQRSITNDKSLIDLIKYTLKSHCAKMFLWIQLQLTSLWTPNVVTCDEDIRQQLLTLPDGLEETYTRCLQRIEMNSDVRSQGIAIRTFRWVACAREPLTSLQAREAVSMSADEMPLTKSKLLSFPVEDFCANLVVNDEHTGRIVFPHPTVKDFLRDPKKVPSDLKKYVLSISDEEVWCGEICLAYVYHLYTRNQIVRYNTQSIPSNFTSSIMKDVGGGWLNSLLRKPPANSTFRMVSPNISHRCTEDLLDCTLDDYMRKHWVSHNRDMHRLLSPLTRIVRDTDNYDLFLDICTSNRYEILPWAAESATEVERYQKLVEYAVLTEHYVLLSAASRHIEHSKPHLWAQVFLNKCPGTDSSWLHISVTLRSLQISRLLATICDLMAVDSAKKTAAVLAVENDLDNLISDLIPDSLALDKRLGLWRNFSDAQHTFVVQLLRTCIEKGSIYTWSCVLRKLRPGLSARYRCDAWLHTLAYGKDHLQAELFPHGMSLSNLNLLPRETDYYKECFNLRTLTPSIRQVEELFGYAVKSPGNKFISFTYGTRNLSTDAVLGMEDTEWIRDENPI